MKKSLLICFFALLPLLFSCSSQPLQPESSEQPVEAEEMDEEATVTTSLPAPFLYRDKDGQTLKLVRILEGGACKNDEQGAVGMFMLYADADDVERIKRTQGEEVFADYEQIIEQFAMLALERALSEMEFAADPFALDDEDAQRRLAQQLADLFNATVAGAIAEFEANTTLTIDLVPLQDSLYFYLDGCEMPHQH